MDYYSILGIPKNASETEIRKAYKKKSMQHHPDRGGDEEEFKKVNEAYQILSDPNKKAAYDNPQPEWQEMHFNSGNMGGFEDMFAQFGFGPGFARQRQRANPDITIAARITLEEAYSGKNLIASYRLRSGQEEVVDISIPAGAKDGNKIRYAGLGEYMTPAKRGSLFVLVQVVPHSKFSVEGNNLHTTTHADIFDFITGGSVEVQTIEGNRIKLSIPEGTNPGTKFSVTGYGLNDLRTNRKGSMIVTINCTIPRGLDENEKTALRKIKKRLAKK